MTRLVFVVLVVLGASGALLMAAGPALAGTPPDAGTLATVRTALLALAAVVLAACTRADLFDLRWLVYPVLALAGVKLLFEDMRLLPASDAVRRPRPAWRLTGAFTTSRAPCRPPSDEPGRSRIERRPGLAGRCTSTWRPDIRPDGVRTRKARRTRSRRGGRTRSPRGPVRYNLLVHPDGTGGTQEGGPSDTLSRGGAGPGFPFARPA